MPPRARAKVWGKAILASLVATYLYVRLSWVSPGIFSPPPSPNPTPVVTPTPAPSPPDPTPPLPSSHVTLLALLGKHWNHKEVQGFINDQGPSSSCLDFSPEECYYFENTGMGLILDGQHRVRKFVFFADKYPDPLPLPRVVHWQDRKSDVRTFWHCQKCGGIKTDCWEEGGGDGHAGVRWRYKGEQYWVDFHFDSAEDDAHIRSVELLRSPDLYPPSAGAAGAGRAGRGSGES